MNEPISNFQEGQWWVAELDNASKGGAPDLKRAVATVHHMLRSAADAGNELALLRKEVRYLRHYGNKDCTTMADDAMRRGELDS